MRQLRMDALALRQAVIEEHRSRSASYGKKMGQEQRLNPLRRMRNGREDFEHETVTAKEDYVLGEVKAGTLVLIHGNVLHKSEKNTSQKGRIIYTFHLIEGEEHFDEKNWLQIPGGPAAFTKLNGMS